jgi:hypothetical protein
MSQDTKPTNDRRKRKMGAAKEARDRAHFQRQFDDEGKRTRLVPVDRYYLQRIEDDLAAAIAARTQLERDLDRCKLRLRERAATLAVERRQWAEDRASLLDRAHGAERAMLMFRRRWEYVSRLLRCFPASQVRALREEFTER